MEQANGFGYQGLAQAISKVEDYTDELEADFHRFYSLDLMELLEVAKWRKISVLIRYLPPESAYLTALREDIDPDILEQHQAEGHGPWSNLEMLVANVSDGISYLAYQQSCINRSKNGPAPKLPTPLRRPGTESEQEKFRKTDRYKNMQEKLNRERLERQDRLRRGE